MERYNAGVVGYWIYSNTFLSLTAMRLWGQT